ncbi:MAG: hypothetical protein ABI867_05575 [Kofleriaceae bacterium]
MTWRRVGWCAGGLVAAWLLALVIIGLAAGSGYGQGIADRMGEALGGSGSVTGSDLALVRGRLAIDALSVKRRDEVGTLDLDVASVRCELAPLGIALVDRDCRELAITGLRMELSTMALFKLKRPKHTPVHAQALVLEDATFVVADKATIRVARIEAGATTFKTPLSFLFSLKTFRATVELAIGKVDLDYANGILTASGGVFGTKPVTLPIVLPIADLADDREAELAKLVAFAKGISDTLVAERLKSMFGR